MAARLKKKVLRKPLKVSRHESCPVGGLNYDLITTGEKGRKGPRNHPGGLNDRRV